MMNIEFLRRLFTACSDESDSHYADGLNLSELYQRLDETVVAEDELIASLKAEFDDDTSGRVDIAIYGYATACEQQGFINGARLALCGVLRPVGGRPDRDGNSRLGRHCGNGGHGMTLRCQCGWTGGLDPHDAQLVAEFIKRSQERDAQASTDRNKKLEGDEADE